MKQIETNRLILRMYSENDAPDVAGMCNNVSIYQHTLNIPYPYTKEDALTWIGFHDENRKNERMYDLAVTDKVTGELYGSVGISIHKAFNNGELGYWIGEEHWGKGYATEAAEAMIRFAFGEKGLHKVYARCFDTNPASGKVIEKLGMKKEGVLREHVKKDGAFVNLIHYGLLGSEG
ncbi:GNAT family N-acetyltransferase [Jeotgalibacillus sp. JSM ZJ347]|uniref:GNAT family N-acetyltransferase n=1 Tax=Jeotgalibacillus sp. JSM ZJ347 TaxID=3342117 RepID=UPI0035A8945B